MITRSAGEPTGYGYLAGNGYEGKTKELDNAVLEIAELLQKKFNTDVVIRYTSDRENGGAFVKDNKYSFRIGIGASLQSSKFHGMTREEKRKLSVGELIILPRDIILYHVMLDDNLSKGSNKGEGGNYYKTINESFDWLLSNINEAAVKEYVEKIKQT